MEQELHEWRQKPNEPPPARQTRDIKHPARGPRLPRHRMAQPSLLTYDSPHRDRSRDDR